MGLLLFCLTCLLLLASGSTVTEAIGVRKNDDPVKHVAELGHCKMCIYVLEVLRSGFPYSLSTICQNDLAIQMNTADFEICQEVVAVLGIYGPSVSLWFSQGCFRTEEYGAVEKMTPCPAHVICSQMETLKDFFTISDYSSTDKYDRHNLRAPHIRDKLKYKDTSRLDAGPGSHMLVQTFCPQPLPQYV